MEHIDRQAIYFSINLVAALTTLATEIFLMAWTAGISDGSAVAVSGRILLALLAVIAITSVMWRMPARPRRQLLMSAGEMWGFTSVTALLIFAGFAAVCAGC
ncbi:MAG: hypothetical protein K2L80_02600 [Muribaculaceae bacterium]|nr:hypothetical protein [Muribaculaceae bacterium]MDE6331471.1 hypothetical protein [Muribaculaceae bacterium]